MLLGLKKIKAILKWTKQFQKFGDSLLFFVNTCGEQLKNDESEQIQKD